MVDVILEYVSIFLALMLVLPVHEFAHAFSAVKSGDFTPKLYNRYTLNPLAHFDITGIIFFVFAGFGWAKPVPINPNNFRHYRRGCFFTAISGVVANYILAFLAFPLFLLSLNIPQFGYFTLVLQNTLYYIFALSLSFFVFNLLPIYPLDGFRVVEAFSKRRGKIYYYLRCYGIYVLYALILLSFIADRTRFYQLDVLGTVMRFLVGIIEKPITLFWGLIF